MPEACFETDNSSNSSNTNKITMFSYEGLANKGPSNWHSNNNSAEVCCFSLDPEQQRRAVPVDVSDINFINGNENTSGTTTKRNFCCCLNEATDLDSCWKLKRRQIILESSNASAKNKTDDVATATLIPTAETVVTEKSTLHSTNAKKSSISLLPTPRSQRNRCSDQYTVVSGGRNEKPTGSIRAQVHKISTSLPATPNLSHLRRPQHLAYKKLSLESDNRNKQSLQEYSTPKYHQQQQQQMSTTTTTTTFQTYASVCRNENVKHPEHMLQAQHLIADQATIAAECLGANYKNSDEALNAIELNTDLVATDTGIAIATDSEIIFAHNNNNNNISNTNLLATNATQATSQTKLSLPHASGLKSSLNFCEQWCCERGSPKSKNTHQQNMLKNIADENLNLEDCSEQSYRAYTDSVSNFSSYGFVSDEDENLSSRHVNTFLENTSTTPIATIPTTNIVYNNIKDSSTNVASHLTPTCTSTPLPLCTLERIKNADCANSCGNSSPTVCCYTSDKFPVNVSVGTPHTKIPSYSATIIHHTGPPTAPLPIPHAKYKYEEKNSLALQPSEVRTFNYESVNSFTSGECLLSTSLPRNYGSANNCGYGIHGRQYDDGDIVNKNLRWRLPPPPVPPKPKHDHTPSQATNESATAYANYDPYEFKRKLEKFEKHNIRNEKSPNINPEFEVNNFENTSPYYDHLVTSTHERSVTPVDCELLSCFGNSKHTTATAQAPANATATTTKTHIPIPTSTSAATFSQKNQQNIDICNRNNSNVTAKYVVARSLSESSCSTVADSAGTANEKCANKTQIQHLYQQQQQQHEQQQFAGDVDVVTKNNNNNSINKQHENSTATAHSRSIANKNNNKIKKIRETNKNYNCKIKVRHTSVNDYKLPEEKQQQQQQQQQLQSQQQKQSERELQNVRTYASEQQLQYVNNLTNSPLPKHTLRYDNHGRLKAAHISHLSTSLSETRLNRKQSATVKTEPISLPPTKIKVLNSSAVNKLNPSLCRKLNFFNENLELKKLGNNSPLSVNIENNSNNENISNDNVDTTEYTISTKPLVSSLPTSPTKTLSNANVTSGENIKIHQSDLDLSFITNQQTEQQLFKSFSDNENFVLKNKLINQADETDQIRCYSDFSLKSNYPSSSVGSLPCKCACKQLNSPTSPISPTSPKSLTSPTQSLTLINQKNSHSLPSVSADIQCPLHWLSSETIETQSSYQKYLDDTQSNCSDQTTIFHIDNDCRSSASSVPSVQSLGNNFLRGPLILKRVPAIQSFGYIPSHTTSASSANVRNYNDKECNMEKRRNTLDRFQRLGFGRKSSPSTTAQQQDGSGGSQRNRKSSEKSERLKELTELLRGNRSSPTPPPVPPPRKPRSGTQSASNSFERSDTHTTAINTAAIDSTPLSFMSKHGDDIILMDQDEPTTDTATMNNAKKHNINTKNAAIDLNCNSTSPRSSTATRFYDTLKPNTSLSNFELLMLGREKSKSPPPIAEAKHELAVSTSIDTKLSRPESRTVIGSYAQKGIPFRSASFSQIELTSGKFKRSALSILRDRLRRDKAIESTSPTNSIVGNANVIVPEQKDAAEVKCEKPKTEPDWIYIPLKRTELSINLSNSQEGKCLEDVIESPDGIPEEDIFNTDTEQTPSVTDDLSREFILNSNIVAHAKMESLTDTIQSENDYTIDETQLPVTVEAGNLVEATSELATAATNQVHINAAEIVQTDLSKGSINIMSENITIGSTAPTCIAPNLATLMEEQMPLESPPDNFLQTATTCLIPVPVYECAAQDWRLENPPQEWVEVAPEEFGLVPETITPLISLEDCVVAETTAIPDQRADVVPRISVSRSSEEADDKSILRKKEMESPVVVERRQQSLDYPEVKKRYSHDDMDIGKEKRTSLDGITTRYSADERKRIDKSKRRKGMYIENEDWAEAAQHNKGLALDINIANLNSIKQDSPEECALMFLSSPTAEDTRTPGSMCSFDLNTPDSECNRAPVWSKDQRLISFSCQSSEEKDDASNCSGSGKSMRNNKTFPYLRMDSVSDNECERIVTSSREHASPSPASSEYDFNKRYSKRPLRGPYGQMLEAEMKKPNKMHFEEILEELRETDVTSQPRRQRGAHDDAGGRNMPQHSNSMRVRKTSTFLPVPAHTRAASTPSQIENVSKNIGHGSNSASIDKINPHEKRYQSTLDNSIRDKDNKQSHTQQQAHHPREMKRAASEAPTIKTHHNKRSQSMSNDKSNKSQHQHLHQQNHSLDHTTKAGNKSKNQQQAAKILPTQELLAELLKGSSEKLLSEQRQQMFADTRTHVVQEIFRNEQSYVESLETVVTKYLKVLKSPEHAGMIDSRTVDEIFFMVQDILDIHQKFLAQLKSRLDNWNAQQKVGDAFMETFSKLEVLEVYTSFVNNCNRAKNAIRTTKHQRPSFAKFLEATSREHKGKLTLDNLLIKPVQKFPNYEMLFQRLIKHTDHDHPDQKHLQDVLKLVHEILVHINCKEREILENGQREATLRELEGVIEGITDLIAPDRQFLIFDLVSMPSGQGARKERGFFLFNDLLVLTSIKKRSGTIRKPNPTTCPGTVASTLDTNKYKFLTKISLDCLDIVKTKDENLKRIMNEIENLAEDCNKLQQIMDITITLKHPHQYLEDVIRELHRDLQRQLSERQTNDAQLNMLELAVNSPNGTQKLTIVFNKTEKRTQWEETFNEAKQKLAATLERHQIPEFLTSIPIRKTRAGLQFTCAAATLSDKRDVWVCNSDGYVGQVCIMSLHPEPNVTSCNGVCNARILCVASVPAYSGSSVSLDQQQQRSGTPQHHSYTQQLRDYRKSISPNCAPSTSIGNSDKKKLQMVANSNGSGTSNNSNNSNNSDIQLDLNLSSSDDETDAGSGGTAAGTSSSSGANDRIPSPAPSTQTTVSTASTAIVGTVGTPYHSQQDSNPEESEGNLSTMWIGTEDGCIHVYNSTDNIRIKKNRIKIEHHSAVYSILYLDNRVFVALANGDICVYLRDGTVWNTTSSHCLSIGTVTSPVTKLLNVHGKLWCSIQGIIKVLDVETLLVVHQIQISSDSKPITNMTVSNNYVWISIQNSAHIKCFHSISHQLITEVNLAPAVNKMLSNCDEIIRQHKAACLRVTSLLSCKDLIWIGTSAGVMLTIPAQGYEKGNATNVVPTGIPHGHTGHVRFITFVETTGITGDNSSLGATKDSDSISSAEYKNQSLSKNQKPKNESNNILIISGGDGYEDFRNSGANSLSEIAGREDSTNHLLIWQI
ncbi:uncharacterized protein LOC119675833 isoform X2 [Teleopsis dalmanni]|uniref:uncharacterized protein LOC119675833 isoform X2 n=1 Tax=Teleopsis dalmanni TaxID=139649 RepID=UPI0018CCD6FB|nr:uncharacterized protein LOC119675833 isoform X2 [Teleopsis dalmanni]